MRFVILHHTGRRAEHYDFMLERDGVLRTWTIACPDFARPQEAVENFDHRSRYLDFEGEVSGGRGRVRRVEEGTYETVSETDREIVVALRGRSLDCRVRLLLQSKRAGEGAPWEAVRLSGPFKMKGAAKPQRRSNKS